MERSTVMAYIITTTVPEASAAELRLEAAQRVYEELLRYISKEDVSAE
jgi:hypothetical protein